MVRRQANPHSTRGGHTRAAAAGGGGPAAGEAGAAAAGARGGGVPRPQERGVHVLQRPLLGPTSGVVEGV